MLRWVLVTLGLFLVVALTGYDRTTAILLAVFIAASDGAWTWLQRSRAPSRNAESDAV